MVDFSSNLDAAATIADRAPAQLIARAGGRMSFMMDILAADGCNGNQPIALHALAAAPEFDFIHDVSGIVRHLDRTTGRLTGCFIPRYARNT